MDGNDPQNADLIYETVGKAQGSVITTKNAQGLTPIHIAIQAGNWVFMNAICGPTSRYLILQESDLPKLKTPDGKSILQFAIEAYASVSQEKKVGVNEAIKYLFMEHPSLASQIDIKTLKTLPEETQKLFSDPGKARLLSIVTKSGANLLHLEGSRVIAQASSTASEATVLRVHSNP